MKLGKREGAQGNFAFLLPPPSREAEEGEQGTVGAWAGGPGVRRQAGVGEKGQGDEGIPSPTTIWVGARRGGGATEAGGWRAAVLWRRRPGSGGKMGRGMRGFGSPTYLGLGWSGAA